MSPDRNMIPKSVHKCDGRQSRAGIAQFAFRSRKVELSARSRVEQSIQSLSDASTVARLVAMRIDNVRHRDNAEGAVPAWVTAPTATSCSYLCYDQTHRVRRFTAEFCPVFSLHLRAPAISLRCTPIKRDRYFESIWSSDLT
jgi:hypothetical protein